MHSPFRSRFAALGAWLALACGLAVSLVAAGSGQMDDQPVEKGTGSQAKQSDALPTFWIIGDSTVKVGTAGQRGWGDELAPFFDAKKINLVNRAIGGRSSRTFITEGRWAEIVKELRKGDVVIMQFGHNDASPINEDPPVTKSTRARGTIKGNGDDTVFVEKNILTGQSETVHSYGWYLRQIIAESRAKGAVPVVCSPIPRKSWNKEGKMNRGGGGYAQWAKEAAVQGGALYIDLNDIICSGYEDIGQQKVEALFGDKGTHTSPEGAAFNARCVVAGLNGLGKENPLSACLSREGKSVKAAKP